MTGRSHDFTAGRYGAKDHTFVVCAYGENAFLERCIESVMRQSVRGKVMICTSTPNKFIADVATKYDVPVFVNEESKGIASDWNYSYKCADTKLMTIVHQDDVYEPAFLEKTLMYLNGAASPQIAFTDYYEIQGNRTVTSKEFINLRIKKMILAPLRAKRMRSSKRIKKAVLSFGNPICCPSVTFVRDNLPEPVFDDGLSSSLDWVAWIRLAGLNGSFVYIPEELVGHRVYPQSSTYIQVNSGLRKREDRQVLNMIWPKPIAGAINRVYSISQRKRKRR